jgi:hypothetical protein
MNTVYPKARPLADLNALVALAIYVGAKLHLYSNDLTPTPANVLADFTEVVASGVVAQTITWSPAFYDVNTLAVSSGGEKLYTQTGGTGDVCYGVFLTDTAGAVLLWSARLDAPPFNFALAGDTLPLTIKMGLDFGLVATSPVP